MAAARLQLVIYCLPEYPRIVKYGLLYLQLAIILTNSLMQ